MSAGMCSALEVSRLTIDELRGVGKKRAGGPILAGSGAAGYCSWWAAAGGGALVVGCFGGAVWWGGLVGWFAPWWAG